MSEDFKLQASYKFGEYDQHMLNVRAENGAELTGHLDTVDVQKVVDFGSIVKAAQNVQPLTQPVEQPAPTVTAPAPVAAAPVASAPSAPPADAMFCSHGQRTKKQGRSARGPWTGYFCPLPKGHPDQCDAVWG